MPLLLFSSSEIIIPPQKSITPYRLCKFFDWWRRVNLLLFTVPHCIPARASPLRCRPAAAFFPKTSNPSIHPSINHISRRKKDSHRSVPLPIDTCIQVPLYCCSVTIYSVSPLHPGTRVAEISHREDVSASVLADDHPGLPVDAKSH